ncbi:MAG: hypothetical protein WCF57_04070 [Pyrinomonadaceae bacterium]
MRQKPYLFLMLAAIALIVLGSWAGYGQKQSPSRIVWEYKIVNESEKISLNEMGAQGWELVTVAMGGAEEVYYFKRVK